METIQEKEHVQNVSHRRYSKRDEVIDSETNDMGMPCNDDVAAQTDNTFGLSTTSEHDSGRSQQVLQLRPQQDRFKEALLCHWEVTCLACGWVYKPEIHLRANLGPKL